jgi:hypothetical protein
MTSADVVFLYFKHATHLSKSYNIHYDWLDSGTVLISANPHNVELTAGDLFQTCRRVSNIQNKMLGATMILFIATFILFWAYLTVKTRHMVKLAKNIPGPTPTPLWKKLLKLRASYKPTGKQQK